MCKIDMMTIIGHDLTCPAQPILGNMPCTNCSGEVAVSSPAIHMNHPLEIRLSALGGSAIPDSDLRMSAFSRSPSSNAGPSWGLTFSADVGSIVIVGASW